MRASCLNALPAQGESRSLPLLADREGFEPPVQLPVRRISSAVLSTTQPPVRAAELCHFQREHGSTFSEQTRTLDQSWTKLPPRPGLSARFYLRLRTFDKSDPATCAAAASASAVEWL